MHQWIEKHANSLFFAGCVAGLAWPYWGWTSDAMVKLILIIATFIACFKLNLGEFKALAWRPLTVMVLLRYTLFAWVLYLLADLIFPTEVALGVLLIAALPSAVAAPAMTNIFNGQVTLAAVITIATTLITPLTLPLLFSFTGATSVVPQPVDLLKTLILVLVLPCVLFVFLRRIQPLKQRINTYGKATTIFLVSVMLAIVVGQQREFVLSDLSLLASMAVLSLAVYSTMLLTGWLASHKFPPNQRIALTISSGYNNAALGIALAALHFSPMVVVVMVAAELAWALLPYITKWLIKN